MITYSTNWMGPVNLNWYRERGLTKIVREVLEEDQKFGKLKKGEVWEHEDITTYYSAGRIDIRGVPDEPWGLEYGVAPMHGEDWNALGDYLWDLTTDTLLSYSELIERFETETGTKIRWAND